MPGHQGSGGPPDKPGDDGALEAGSEVGGRRRNQIEKLVPQPQAAVALGLWILKAAPISSST